MILRVFGTGWNRGIRRFAGEKDMGNESKIASDGTAVSSAEREQFSAELEKFHMAPLWTVYREVLTPEPRLREIPYLWPWSVVRPRLLRAGELITAAEAERRVLMFVNPNSPTRIGSTATIYTAAQLILPGESARAHRHSPAALRFLIEGRGAFTCVDGERVWMAPGDLILTPSMVWHDHGNEGSEPVMWLDGLDLPLMASFNSMFLQEFGEWAQPETMPRARSEKLFGRGLFPSGSTATTAVPYSPVWAYRWEDAREALQSLAQSSDADPFDGFLLEYVNPATGGEIFPTMGCRLQLLPKGSHTSAHRHTGSFVYHVAEGSGFSVVNGMRLDWQKGDTFAVPIWCWHEHAAPAGDAVLFSVTDEPLLAPLGLLRTEPWAGDSCFQPVGSVFGKP
jgi:gentisate 1,2-dioxygenase